MRVHHLNCGTMRPALTPGGLVCHVLLVETGDGLLLVDSGFGLRDAADPARRIGGARHLIRPVLDASETASRQVRRLGHDPAAVRDIVLTHGDADHTGGLADFPHARVHLTAAESDAVQRTGPRQPRPSGRAVGVGRPVADHRQRPRPGAAAPRPRTLTPGTAPPPARTPAPETASRTRTPTPATASPRPRTSTPGNGRARPAGRRAGLCRMWNVSRRPRRPWPCRWPSPGRSRRRRCCPS
nr:MBL fold metallo-hydrolase [Actinoplanes philippinensis]